MPRFRKKYGINEEIWQFHKDRFAEIAPLNSLTVQSGVAPTISGLAQPPVLKVRPVAAALGSASLFFGQKVAY